MVVMNTVRVSHFEECSLFLKERMLTCEGVMKWKRDNS